MAWCARACVGRQPVGAQGCERQAPPTSPAAAPRFVGARRTSEIRRCEEAGWATSRPWRITGEPRRVLEKSVVVLCLRADLCLEARAAGQPFESVRHRRRAIAAHRPATLARRQCCLAP